jgi:hypothetical protein
LQLYPTSAGSNKQGNNSIEKAENHKINIDIKGVFGLERFIISP